MRTYFTETHDEKETLALAHRLGKYLGPGDVIALFGDIGAGKTTFTKGLAFALGVTRHVNSPTFTLIKEYKGSVPFYHMDLYRIEGDEDYLELDEYFYGNGVSVIEWPELISGQLPEERLEITIQRNGEERRNFFFQPYGKRMTLICEELWGHETVGD